MFNKKFFILLLKSFIAVAYTFIVCDEDCHKIVYERLEPLFIFLSGNSIFIDKFNCFLTNIPVLGLLAISILTIEYWSQIIFNKKIYQNCNFLRYCTLVLIGFFLIYILIISPFYICK